MSVVHQRTAPFQGGENRSIPGCLNLYRNQCSPAGDEERLKPEKPIMKKKALSDDLAALRRRAEERLQKNKQNNKIFSMSPGDMHRLIHELSVHQIELQMQQEELLQSRDDMEKGLERYTELYDFAPVGYLTLARDSTILEVNLTATKMLGVDRSLLKGSRLTLFVDPDEIKTFNALMESVFSHQEPDSCEVMLLHKDDPSASRCTVRIDAAVQDDGQSCWTVLSDVTRQKKIERENAQLQATLVQAQKLESIGRLAGGVAHEFNNLLQVMLGNVDILCARKDLDVTVHFSLAAVRNSIMKSAIIVRQLLAFARKQIISPVILDLNAVVEDNVKMLKPLLGEHIKLIFISGDVWPVKADSMHIDQVMINLALNARDAIKESGTLVITTKNIVVDAAFCNVHSEMVPGDYVLLEVCDDGCGMDNDTLASIFEPFFTTKPMAEGTGLGLSMVYGIVRQNRGTILAYSTKGKGTTFEIYLPRSAAKISSLSSGETQ